MSHGGLHVSSVESHPDSSCKGQWKAIDWVLLLQETKHIHLARTKEVVEAQNKLLHIRNEQVCCRLHTECLNPKDSLSLPRSQTADLLVRGNPKVCLRQQ